ncbi:MAG: tetratricopeptide repeat protein [Candidatus Lernaella stagnicola]|nr:tetratricopeptide repeat protein [Candidatus Lernaella stagnicola]
MKRLLLLALVVVAAGAFGWWYVSGNHTPRASAKPTPPGPTLAAADVGYPTDPKRLAQWIDETVHELIYKKEKAARRWSPLLAGYCEQGCEDCCGLQAYALQILGQWEEASAYYKRHASAACLFAEAREFSHHRNEPEIALPLYERACHLGLLIACSNAGVILALGNGVPKNPDRAACLYLEACEGGEPIACANLAMLHESGAGPLTDDRKINVLYQRACEAGYTRGCNRLGLRLRDALPQVAANFFYRSCEQGDMRGCLLLADTIAFDRPNEARQLYERACRGGYEPACR